MNTRLQTRSAKFVRSINVFFGHKDVLLFFLIITKDWAHCGQSAQTRAALSPNAHDRGHFQLGCIWLF
jgi:hypothetical protein